LGRRETALPILLSLARSLLITLVDGTPFAGTGNVHPFFDAQLIATSGAHTASSGGLFAVTLMPNAYAGTSCFAGIDVVASISAAHRLEYAWAVATRWTGHAPEQIWIRRQVLGVQIAVGRTVARGGWNGHAGITDETIVGRAAMHRLVATAPMLNIVLTTSSILDGVSLAILAAHEAFGRDRAIAARSTTSGNHHADGTSQNTSQPTSIHRRSPPKRIYSVSLRNFGASADPVKVQQFQG